MKQRIADPIRFRSRLRTQAAYTLLELMLALALLGALMTVAWSLMGTFRDAEQRGWKLSHRVQTIRSAREWLQSDMQQLLQPDTASANAKKFRLSGNSLGFTATIAPSLDPLPFLENLMSSSTDGLSSTSNTKINPEPAASLYSDSDTTAARAEQSLWPPETLDVEYQLTPDESSTSAEASLLQPTDLNDVQFSLTRRELADGSATPSATSPNSAPKTNNLADRVLTAQDLYRQTDETSRSTGTPIRETKLDGLTNVQFQYFDGMSWRPEWNSDQAGGLPRAIALCFDFPATADIKRTEPTTSSSQTEGGLSDPNDLLASNPTGNTMSFADAALAAQPTAESTSSADSDSSLTEAATHEVQIVVYISGQAKTQGTKQSFGSKPNNRSRGGFR